MLTANDVLNGIEDLLMCAGVTRVYCGLAWPRRPEYRVLDFETRVPEESGWYWDEPKTMDEYWKPTVRWRSSVLPSDDRIGHLKIHPHTISTAFCNYCDASHFYVVIHRPYCLRGVAAMERRVFEDPSRLLWEYSI